MTSIIEQMGKEAARAGKLANQCPYKGLNPGSGILRRRWLRGFEAGIRQQMDLAAQRRKTHRAEYLARRRARLESRQGADVEV